MDGNSPLAIPEEISDDPLQAALQYAAAGWYVIPVKAGTKNPGSVVGKDWPTRSTRDPEQIAALWAGTDHGIALHVGRSGAVVFDVDNPEALPPELHAELKRTPFQSTRETQPQRGHYVFETSRPLGNSLGSLPKGWGDVRGTNGVIIVQPSMHPEHDTHGGWYQWIIPGPVAPLPEWIDASLPDAARAQDAATDEDVQEFMGAHLAESRPQLIAGWVRGFERDVRDGASRHTSMATRLAGAMKEARAGYFSAPNAARDLRWAFVQAVTRDGWAGEQGAARTESQANHEFDGLLAWAVGQANAADIAAVEARTTEKTAALDASEAMFDIENLPRSRGKDEWGEEAPGASIASTTEHGGVSMYLTRSELDDMPRGQPLIDGVLDRHCTAVISGRDQTYKSFFLLDLMLCMATGVAFHGHKVQREPVLLVVGEGAYGLASRVSAWEAQHGVRVEDDWLHVRRMPVNLFRNGVGVDELVSRVSEFKYGLVAFDTLQRNTAGADANSAKDAGIIYSALDRIRVATDRGSVLFVAHTGKDDRDVRGSSAFEDDADIVWKARRDNQGEAVRFALTKRKDGPDGLSFHLLPLQAHGSLVLVSPSQGGLVMKERQPAHALEFLQALARPAYAGEWVSRTEIGSLSGTPAGSLPGVMTWLADAEMISMKRSGRSWMIKLTDYGKLWASQAS